MTEEQILERGFRAIRQGLGDHAPKTFPPAVVAWCEAWLPAALERAKEKADGDAARFERAVDDMLALLPDAVRFIAKKSTRVTGAVNLDIPFMNGVRDVMSAWQPTDLC